MFLQGYDKIVNDLEQTRERRHVLKKYYSKIKKVLSDTQGISLQEEAGDFLNRAEKYNKDLKNKKFIVLVAGKLSQMTQIHEYHFSFCSPGAFKTITFITFYESQRIYHVPLIKHLI